MVQQRQKRGLFTSFVGSSSLDAVLIATFLAVSLGSSVDSVGCAE